MHNMKQSHTQTPSSFVPLPCQQLHNVCSHFAVDITQIDLAFLN